jgi:catechol 2,3-dioxygenase-like lactoylglutathione lyase family enzyme
MILIFLLKAVRISAGAAVAQCGLGRSRLPARRLTDEGARECAIADHPFGPVSSRRQQTAHAAAVVMAGGEMASTLAQNVFQIGFVVPDIHKGMAFFKDKLGVPEFLFIEKPELQDETYLGKPAPLRLHLAFGWCGDTQVELTQPIEGVSTYSKFLDHNRQGGMHHYGIEVPDYGKGVREMEASGFALVQGGRHNETRFAYFDTTGTIGALTEIVYLQPEERAFMQGLKHKK